MVSPPSTEFSRTFDRETSVQEARVDTNPSTLTMASDAPVVIEASHQETSRLDVLYKGITALNRQDIVEFLAKPYPVATGTFTTATSPSSYTTITLDSMFTGNPNYEKARRFLLTGYTAVVRLVLNATPFQAGQVYVVHEPAYSDITTNTDLQRRETAVTMPHVILDMAEQTEAILECPFIHVLPAMDRSSGTPAGGAIHYGLYTPLRVGSGAPTYVSYTIWVHFKDLRFAVAYSQSGKPLMRESKKATGEKGPIEEALLATGKVTTALSRIPLISSYIQPISWAAGIAARVAGAFGWSRPAQTEAITRIRYNETDYMANCDGAEPAMPLSASLCNRIAPSVGYSDTAMDEMAIDHIKKRWGVVERFTWTTSNLAEVQLTNVAVLPRVGRVVSEYTSIGTLYRHSPVAWLSGFFQYWRGSLRYRLRIAKTKFHSGRLMVVFKPGVTGAYPGSVAAPVWADAPYCYSLVVDLRQSSIVEFTVPYSSSRVYSHHQEPMGVMAIFVVNQLVAPEVVASTIDITLEMCGGDDLEFAGVRTSSYDPVRANPPPLPLLDIPSDPMADQAFSQAGIPMFTEGGAPELGVSEDVPIVTLGGLNTELKMTTDAAQEAIGEQILSVKQLAMLSSQFLDSTAALTDLPGLTTFIPLDGVGIPYGLDNVSQVLAPFRFVRGSVIYRLVTITATPTLAFMGFNSTTAVATGGVISGRSRQILIGDPGSSRLYSYKVPFHSHYGAFVNAPTDTSFNTSQWLSARTMVRFQNINVTSDRRFIYRAAADDLQAFCFLAVPLTTVQYL